MPPIERQRSERNPLGSITFTRVKEGKEKSQIQKENSRFFVYRKKQKDYKKKKTKEKVTKQKKKNTPQKGEKQG